MENPKTKWYIGILQVGEPTYVVIFSSTIIPTNASYGDVYKYAMGPYATRKEAVLSADYHHFRIRNRNPGVEWHEEKYQELLKKRWPKSPRDTSRMLGRTISHKEAMETGVDTGEEWHKRRKDSFRQELESKGLSKTSRSKLAGRFDEELYSKKESRKFGMNPEEDSDKQVLDFVHKRSICDGNWHENPIRGETKIYDKIQAIEAQKGKDSLWPKENFRHDFKDGGEVIGLPNGDLLIKKKNKRLWKNFDYE